MAFNIGFMAVVFDGSEDIQVDSSGVTLKGPIELEGAAEALSEEKSTDRIRDDGNSSNHGTANIDLVPVTFSSAPSSNQEVEYRIWI